MMYVIYIMDYIMNHIHNLLNEFKKLNLLIINNDRVFWMGILKVKLFCWNKYFKTTSQPTWSGMRWGVWEEQ